MIMEGTIVDAYVDIFQTMNVSHGIKEVGLPMLGI
jgi:hypothetical protein